MANLIDRIENPATRETVISGGERMISIHKFTSALVLYSQGHATKNQIISKFSLDNSAQIQLNVILTVIDNLSTDIDKVLWFQRLEAAGLFYEDGTRDSAWYKSVMGF